MVYYSTSVKTQFTLLSGTYTDEQELLGSLDTFLVDTVGGWSRLKTITDTPTDKNIAYYSDGYFSSFYDRFYLRIRATSDGLSFNGSSFFDTVGDVEDDPFGGADTAITVGTTSGTFWFLANEDAVHVVVSGTTTTLRHGGFGFWNTYYSRVADPKPFYTFGQESPADTFESTLRVRSYGPHSWGSSMSTSGAAISGSEQWYEADHPSDITEGTPNARTGQPCFMEPVFYTDAVYTAAEVRGEIPGLFLCGGAPYHHGSITVVSGTRSPAGSYFLHKYSDYVAWALGPIETIAGG